MDAREQSFLKGIRSLSAIGYGRMIQIIAYEWSETQLKRGAMELMPCEVPNAADMECILAAKRADPLSDEWENFG